MKNSDMWNLIASDFQKLYQEKEAAVDKRWQQYCTDLLGYRSIFDEIKSQSSVHVGSHYRAIPDIILSIDGQEVFDIELKKYSLAFQEDFELQLISYFKLKRISVGMIVCESIYLYSYDYPTDEIMKIEIPFTKDSPRGTKLIQLLQRQTFNSEDITGFVKKEVLKENRLKDMQALLTPRFVRDAVVKSLSESYSEEEIEMALRNFTFSVSQKNNSSVAHNPIQHSVETPDKQESKNPTTNEDVYIRVSSMVHHWCQVMTEKGALQLSPDKCTEAYNRFTTKKMDEIITVQPGIKSGWGNGHFYYYEVRNSKQKNTISMQLALTNINATENLRDIFNKLFVFVNKFPKKSDWKWRIAFHAFSFKYSENITESEIFYNLNRQWEVMQNKEKEWAEFFNKNLQG